MKAYLILDGTLLPIDRIAADRPFYSGKHKKHGMNVQVISDPKGRPRWASSALAGAVHDIRAAREHRILDALAQAGIVRGEGKWEHTGRTYRSIARYWHVLDPILKGWLADGIESLREITRDDVKRAIATRKGTPARSIHIVLRNVFRALRQEGVIFRDPTRGLVFAGVTTPPPSVPSDRLAGVLNHAKNDFQRFVMVLVCIHALSGTDIRRLLLTDLDLSRERLIVRRPGKRHIIYLDELTYRCASAWLRERHRRWPVTTNPHLLVNRWTAVDTTHSPIGTVQRHLPAHRTHDAYSAAGPDPRRGIPGRQPTSPDAPVRHLLSHRDAVHHRGPPRTHCEAPSMR